MSKKLLTVAFVLLALVCGSVAEASPALASGPAGGDGAFLGAWRVLVGLWAQGVLTIPIPKDTGSTDEGTPFGGEPAGDGPFLTQVPAAGTLHIPGGDDGG